MAQSLEDGLDGSGVEPRQRARFVSDLDRVMHPLRRPLLAHPLLFAAIVAGCGGKPGLDAPLFGTGVFHPPPKPGASISQTRMCECKACDPRNCCDGPSDDQPAVTCGESYDFSDPACGISVTSCTSRCSREVWRVKSNEECAAKRPASCCEAG